VSANVDLVLTPPKWAHLALNHFPFESLRIDNPDARRGNEDVIDVPASAGDEAVVERDDSVADLTLYEHCKP
jgi:hypothetical protein